MATPTVTGDEVDELLALWEPEHDAFPLSRLKPAKVVELGSDVAHAVVTDRLGVQREHWARPEPFPLARD